MDGALASANEVVASILTQACQETAPSYANVPLALEGGEHIRVAPSREPEGDDGSTAPGRGRRTELEELS
jgi:hypothetical protein